MVVVIPAEEEEDKDEVVCFSYTGETQTEAADDE